MKSFSTLFLTLLFIFMISCGHGLLKQNETDSWLNTRLNTISGGKPHEIDVSGKWYDAQGSTFFGWGEGYLRQEQNKISGAIGNYNIKGLVLGKTVYLVFIYAGNVYYTARLEMFQDLLTGNYFKANDRRQEKGYPTSFARTVEPIKK